MKKEVYTLRFGKMPIEDKLLLIMEWACYLFTLGTIIAIVFALNEGVTKVAGMLIFSAAGLFACGRSSRSTRDSRLIGWQLNIRTGNKKINNLKLNPTSNIYN